MSELVREVQAARARLSLRGYPNAREFRADSGFPERDPIFPKRENPNARPCTSYSTDALMAKFAKSVPGDEEECELLQELKKIPKV